MKAFRKLPSHILRDNCLKYLTKKWQPGNFLEIGSGRGETTKIFLIKEYYGVCCDISEESRGILKQNLEAYNDKIKIACDFKTLGQGSFDYLFSFDVLEHIKDDCNALRDWSSYLKTGGMILISVPAHAKEFNRSDELMGHVKRYEKKELFNLLHDCGYEDIRIACYGFPLLNVTLKAMDWVYKFSPGSTLEYSSLTPEEKTIASGTRTPNIVNLLSFLSSEITNYPFVLLQRLFLNKDLGVGYIAWGRKK